MDLNRNLACIDSHKGRKMSSYHMGSLVHFSLYLAGTIQSVTNGLGEVCMIVIGVVRVV